TFDSIIWIACVFDSTTEIGSYQTGGGLAFSKDFGLNWTFVPQPIDSVGNKNEKYEYYLWDGDSVKFLKITVPVQNTTWDISLTNKYVYLASWAGGIRRSSDFGASWQRIPLPSDDDDVLECGEQITFPINPKDPSDGGNHNHKGFSVLAYGDTVWVGTANGINMGIAESDSCIRWRKYNAQNSAISGNFVVAMARQVWNGKETLWAATLTAESSGEYQAISKTSDGGLTWSTTLTGERGYNFAFDDSIVYVCTASGLFKSIDGENWALYDPVQDSVRRETLFSHDVYTAVIDPRESPGYLWIGTADGIGKTRDDGIHWSIYHQSVSTKIKGEPQIYAFPNPFSPTHHNILNGDGHVRIKYHIDGAAQVRLEIYDFAMRAVYKSDKQSITTAGEYTEPWNGRNSDGTLVANGTYFCKLTQESQGKEKSYWTKLIVVK
ncbi:MAG: FlgD immunoglobulin-like domain containing protein, partial [Candidatus Marinimicrobia bacterium]|nr:FlgD immunoglobulin-like domain containing protein [Candidatus Neomarinimicrobiota bacterium]